MAEPTIKSAMEALASQFNLKIVEDETEKKDEASTSSDSTPGADTPATEKSEKDPALEGATIGSINNIKDLYQGPEDSQGRAQWLDKYPEDAAEAAENEETEKYAFIARKTKCFSGRKKFDIHSIIVNSPAVKKVLGKVFNRNHPISAASTTKFKTVNAVAACSAFKPTFDPSARTVAEWRY